MVADTYKSFFTIETELADSNLKKNKDGEEKKDSDEKDKFFSALSIKAFKNTYINTYYTLISLHLPKPYALMPELPPEIL